MDCRYSLDALVDVMATLRGPGGCPWDLEQDHHTLKRYAVEEVYELLDAIDSGRDDAMVEELGDVLLQVAFHCQIAAESGRFDINSVVRTIHDKLVRRHPHVFGSGEAKDPAAVERRWAEIKKEEKAGADASPTSLMDGVSSGLPALAYASTVQRRAATVGFEWDDVSGALAKVSEEVAEIAETATEPSHDKRRLEEEWGDLLFSLVNVARYWGVDPESALRTSTAKFTDRFRSIEAMAKEQGRSLDDMTLQEMDALWDDAKRGRNAP